MSPYQKVMVDKIIEKLQEAKELDDGQAASDDLQLCGRVLQELAVHPGGEVNH